MKAINNQLSFFDKPRIQFLVDNKNLNEKFIKGAEFEVYMEEGEHYIIYLDEVFYGTWKKNCRKV